MLRIELKKALIQQEVAPKMTQLRQQKLAALKGKNAEDTADAEMDVIQAQTAQAISNIAVKELQLQLNEAIKEMNAAPAPGRPAAPGASPAPGQAQPPAEPGASPAEISMLQLELEKAKISADAAAKVADNRQTLLKTRQAQQAAGQATEVQVADAEADALAAQTNARLAALEVEASQLRLDDAVKSAKK